MTAAAFILVINLFIAGIFATAFGLVAAYEKSAIGARWLATAYGLGMLNAALELVLPFQADPRLAGIGIFMAFLLALACAIVGLARHYRVEPPWHRLGLLIGASAITIVLIIDMPRDSMLRAVAYQFPYFAMQMLGVLVIIEARHRQALDVALLVLFALSGLHFLTKPLIAAAIGSGASPQAYITSSYAAISQSLGAILLIANGLLMLLVLVRDAMAEMTARSETDKLSGLLNRRGFENHATRSLEAAQRIHAPSAMIVADLDHFKAINDTFGHEAGDRVIVAFARILRATSDERALVGRLGGEEFAILIPGANLATARLYAEGVRSGFAGASAITGEGYHHSASFGVAALRPDDRLSDLLRRADAALYEAKRGGRDRVAVSHDDQPANGVVTPLARDRRRGSRQAS